MHNLALYIHWPFCESKCPYCDFNSHVRESINQQEWLRAYLLELNYYRNLIGNKNITSIFFGGGTPSLMTAETVNEILSHVKKTWNVSENVEITLEANPSSSEIDKFKSLADAGINRLSLGIQSFDDKRLKFLGRKHSAEQGKQAIKMAAKLFNNFSFDLIYNLPEQTRKEIKDSMDIAFNYASPHMSLYQLTIEKGTEFFKEYRNNKFSLPNQEQSFELYNYVTDECSKNGLEKYEISNYAKNGYECSHNLNYWNYNEYLGIGAGAHSRIDLKGKRYAIFDIHKPEKWLKNTLEFSNGIQKKEQMDSNELLSEIFFMGLRTKYGVNKKILKILTNKTFSEIFNNQLIEDLKNENYLYETKTHIKLTQSGSILHSGICKKLMNSMLN